MLHHQTIKTLKKSSYHTTFKIRNLAGEHNLPLGGYSQLYGETENGHLHQRQSHQRHHRPGSGYAKPESPHARIHGLLELHPRRDRRENLSARFRRPDVDHDGGETAGQYFL